VERSPAPSRDPGVFDRVGTLGGEIPVAAAVAALGAEGGPAPAGTSAAVAAAVGPDPPLAAGSEGPVKIISQDASGMVLELRVKDPSLSPVVLDGAPYTDVRIEGFSQFAEPGKPALPLLGVPVEIPDVADVAMGVDVRKVKTLHGLHVPAPAPTLTLQPDGSLEARYVPDAAVYGGSTVFPAAPVSLGGSVRQGEKRLLVLVLSPVSWSPATGVLEQARRIRVRLDFHGAGAVEAAESADARLANQFLLASRGALKIAVSETGVQALTGEALLAAGLSPDTDPRRLCLYREGREVAIHIEGEADGVLDPDDRLLFYGEALDDDHALARTYWLMGANLMGRRMAIENGTPTGLPSGEETTPAKVRLEKNLVYVPFVLNGEVSNFVGESIFLDPRDQWVALEGVTGGPATLRLRVQGATRDDGIDPDHHLAVSVNGVPVGDAFWDGFDAFEGSFDIPPGALVEGDNQVRLTPVADTGALFDFDYVDWVEITYPRSLDRAGAAFSLETTSAGDRTLTDLAGEGAVLLDVTDPFSPRLLQGGVFEPGPGGGSLAFSVGPGERRLLMATGEGILTPGAVWRDTPSQLHAAEGLDWLAIAHPSLVAGTQPLADLHAGEGLRAAVVSVEDVYDEFGYGNPGPEAIRDYLAWQYARGGTPRLRYVLLVGDASYDERDFLGQPNRNLVPTKLLDGVFTERSSDNWFASFLGDDAMPDVALGRLPVKDEGELAVVVGKIAGYAGQPLGQGWQGRALLVADDGAKAFHAGEAAIFESSMDRFAAQLPPGFDPLKLYLSDIPEAQQHDVARQAILDALGAGALMAVYSGHGAITLWADEVIFRADDLGALSNADRLPFVVVLNCLNGLFSAPLGDSLGESMLLKPDGGAVAFFAPTGVSPIGGQEVLGEGIARALFREGQLRIGDALVRAREALLGTEFFEDLSNSWVLLGDPATRLALLPVPIAEAGADREVRAKTSVRLEGRSSGGDFGAVTYAWSLVSTPAGSAARLDRADSRKPVLRVDLPGDYVVALTVSAGGRTSVPDTVTLHALPWGKGKGGTPGSVF
jgi:hypothetical protein